jgi:hypothetical protein
MARVTPEPAGAPFLRVLCARVGILNTQSDNFILPLQRSGNRKTRTDKRLGTTLTYAYDNIYQLLTAKQGTTTKESYTGACPERYSSREAMRVSRRNPVGNRLSSVGVSPYSYNSSNELTSIPGTTYAYDNNGNTRRRRQPQGQPQLLQLRLRSVAPAWPRHEASTGWTQSCTGFQVYRHHQCRPTRRPDS